MRSVGAYTAPQFSQDAEIRRITRNVPVAEFAVFAEPFLGLGDDFALQSFLAVCIQPFSPAAQKFHALRVRQLEEKMLRRTHFRRRAGERGVRILEVRRRVHRAAVFAGIAVLVFGATLRAFALDVAVRQEHALDRVEELFDGPGCDEARRLQLAVDVLRQLGVLGRVGRMPVVDRQVKAVEIIFARGRDLGDEFLRCLARLLGGDHDRRAVRVVGAHPVHLMTLHTLEAHPDVGLDVLHHVAQMELAVRIGEGRGDEDAALVGASGHR